jgi:ABC-type Zn uptake system ZnuABC Zn-binding protein ZnuA
MMSSTTKFLSLLLAAAIVGGGLVACGSSSTPPATGGSAAGTPSASKLEVVATTTQVTDFTIVIGGDCATVYGVLKPNVDPHDYEPSPADLDALAHAEVIAKNGVGLEKWLDDTVTSSGTRAVVVDSSAGVEVRAGDSADPAGDPHIWQNPMNVKIMATNIEQAMARARPACAEEFSTNLADYSAQLDQLDRDTAAAISTLTNEKLVTNHDAFGYYVDRYGLDFVGSIIPSFDTSAELSASAIADLVAQIRVQGVKAIFSESSLPPKTADAIGQEAGVTVVQGGNALYGDTLGPAGSDGATYLTMMAHNTRTIVANLR